MRASAFTFALLAGAATLAGCETMAEEAAEATQTTYRASLTGAQEVPTPGDPDGSGRAEVSIVDSVDRICYELDVTAIAPATAAHIHRGRAGEAGPPVVTLQAPSDGSSTGCVDAADAVIDPIKADPAGFYVNVHNAEYPGGAVRGQLGR